MTTHQVLVELLRLYDWRLELGRMERDPKHDEAQMAKWLRQYGREKKAAWDEARKVCEEDGPCTCNGWPGNSCPRCPRVEIQV